MRGGRRKERDEDKGQGGLYFFYYSFPWESLMGVKCEGNLVIYVFLSKISYFSRYTDAPRKIMNYKNRKLTFLPYFLLQFQYKK